VDISIIKSYKGCSILIFDKKNLYGL